MSCRFLENRPGPVRWWLGHLAMQFVLSNSCLKLSRVFPVQTYPQQHHNFRRLDHPPCRKYNASLIVKSELTLLAKTTITIAQVQLIMLEASHNWIRNLILGSSRT